MRNNEQIIGGLSWSIVSGAVLIAPNPDGTAIYTAPSAGATVVLKLAVATGPAQGTNHTYTVLIVPPQGHLSTFNNIHHVQGFISVGFMAHIYLTPTYVSFAHLKFQEASVTGIGSGYVAPINGVVHPLGSLLAISGCNISTGCIAGNDTVDTNSNPPPFSAGDFLWPIPWECQNKAGTMTTFMTANHHETLRVAASPL